MTTPDSPQTYIVSGDLVLTYAVVDLEVQATSPEEARALAERAILAVNVGHDDRADLQYVSATVRSTEKWSPILHITWECDTVWTGSVPSLREDYGQSNLFDDDLGWMCAGPGGLRVDVLGSLDEVIGVIRPGQRWISGNCSVRTLGQRSESGDEWIAICTCGSWPDRTHGPSNVAHEEICALLNPEEN